MHEKTHTVILLESNLVIGNSVLDSLYRIPHPVVRYYDVQRVNEVESLQRLDFFNAGGKSR